MRDDSLMNPVHLKSEINYLERTYIPMRTARVADLQSRITEAFKPFHVTNIREDNTYVLTTEQVDDVLTALAGCKVDLDTHAFPDPYYLRVYKALLTDRRWLIASKLKFLAK